MLPRLASAVTVANTTPGFCPMPTTATLSSERDRLRTALANRKTEQEKLDALEQARTRAMEQSWDLASKLRDAEESSRLARAEEPSRLARAYTSGDRDAISPVEVAQTTLDKAQSEYHQIEQVEDALTNEIITATSRVQDAQTKVHAALAALVCSSSELQHLYVELEQAWARLRGVRKAFALIQHQMNGHMPQPLVDRWIASVSLNPEAVLGSDGHAIPTDEIPVQAWSEALARLLDNPDAPLPSQV
jgi:hypothetical protein